MQLSILSKLQAYFFTNPSKTDTDYRIPSLWYYQQKKTGIVTVNFNTYYLQIINEIISQADPTVNYNQSISYLKNTITGTGGEWTYTASIYNLFPRLTTSFDHNGDGIIGNNDNSDCTLDTQGLFRETGTFLKCIALLPYLKNLGVNTIHLMPITAIGKDGNRGELGSVYAIKNPYEIDPNLAEAAIPFSEEEQCKAFIEAAHILGFRVIMEFVLRTASLDSDWIKTNPEWFYWIDKNHQETFHSPIFSKEELMEIKKIPYGHSSYIPPAKSYRKLFQAPPKSSEIELSNKKHIGKTKFCELVIPGAFADWPPDDIQPAWSDVTYLRLYNYPLEKENNYNYIAYNTIRYYDPELTQNQYINHPLWTKIIGIIPHYQKSFGIDGVMIDMGHAMPKALMNEVIKKTRTIDPDFAFLEENFTIEWSSKQAGFNATVGFEWEVAYSPEGIKQLITTAASKLALPFFGTAENHNTPRTYALGGEKMSKQLYALTSFLPNCIPFIHSGYELGESFPVNTGLNFTLDEINSFNNKKLGLFDRNSYNWTPNNTILDFIQQINLLRNSHFKMIANGDETSIYVHPTINEADTIICYERFSHEKPWDTLLVIANMDYEQSQVASIPLFGTYNNTYKEYLSQQIYSCFEHTLTLEMKPGEVMLFEIDKYFG